MSGAAWKSLPAALPAPAEVPASTRAGGAPAAWRAANLALLAAAVWPVWFHLGGRFRSPGADPSGLMVLLLAVAWAVSLPGQTRAPSRRWWVLMPLGAYAWAYPHVPALARVELGLLAVGWLLLTQADAGWRERSGLAWLLLLCGPPPDTLNFFLGGFLRALAAPLAATALRLSGVPAHAEGPALWVSSHLFSVDAPCSGVNGLWTGCVAAAALAAAYRLTPLRTLALVAAGAVVCVPANAWRIVALVHYQHGVVPHLRPAQVEHGHVAIGLVVFAATLACLVALVHRPAERRSGDEEARVPASGRIGVEQPEPHHRSTSLLPHAVLPVFCLAVGVVPLMPAAPAVLPPAARFPGWPKQWEGAPLVRLPETELDQRWGALMPGPLARFTLPAGDDLLLRWVERCDRSLHPPEDCYRGQGRLVTLLPPVSLAVPRFEGQTAPVRAVPWGRFEVAQGAARWEVRTLIVSRVGPTYTDASWWWFQVNVAGRNRDPGPWWVVALQHRL